jgi:hypothetical protein
MSLPDIIYHLRDLERAMLRAGNIERDIYLGRLLIKGSVDAGDIAGELAEELEHLAGRFDIPASKT